jgi:hypothetical protein
MVRLFKIGILNYYIKGKVNIPNGIYIPGQGYLTKQSGPEVCLNKIPNDNKYVTIKDITILGYEHSTQYKEIFDQIYGDIMINIKSREGEEVCHFLLKELYSIFGSGFDKDFQAIENFNNKNKNNINREKLLKQAEELQQKERCDLNEFKNIAEREYLNYSFETFASSNRASSNSPTPTGYRNSILEYFQRNFITMINWADCLINADEFKDILYFNNAKNNRKGVFHYQLQENDFNPEIKIEMDKLNTLINKECHGRNLNKQIECLECFNLVTILVNILKLEQPG